MISRTHAVAAWRLMRPAQWPILSAQLLVGMALAAPPSGPAQARWFADLDGRDLGLVWFTWVVLLNGGTLAFNSAWDRDTGPVAYLTKPPPPPPHLAAAAVGIMSAGAVLGGLLVSPALGILLGACTLLSVLYSHPATRWKSRPGLDLLVNGAGYGCGTTLAGLMASGGPTTLAGWWFTAGFGLLFGSFYPLTQIYQCAADRQRGDRTLTTALGPRRALVLAIILSILAAGAFWQASPSGAWPASLVLWAGHLGWWWSRAKTWSDAAHEKAMYRALGLWALMDAVLAASWLLRPSG